MKHLFTMALVFLVTLSTAQAAKENCTSSELCNCSQLARYIKVLALQEHAAPSFRLSGETECLGLTPEDIHKIDFQKIDMSDYITSLSLDVIANQNKQQIK
jgi:hypothetical protein